MLKFLIRDKRKQQQYRVENRYTEPEVMSTESSNTQNREYSRVEWIRRMFRGEGERGEKGRKASGLFEKSNVTINRMLPDNSREEKMRRRGEGRERR